MDDAYRALPGDFVRLNQRGGDQHHGDLGDFSDGSAGSPTAPSQRSKGDFYANGLRDDIQYFRDFYNVQRIEGLKGSNVLILGRGGGGLVYRVLEEAEGVPIREVSLCASTRSR